MKSIKKTAIATAISMAVLSPFALAGEKKEMHHETHNQNENTFFQNGWKEGKIEAAFLLNENLNNFSIDVAVEGEEAKLSGYVSSEIEKDLAEEIALSTKGITKVDNQLSLKKEANDMKEAKADRSFSDAVADATITAKVKMGLVANSNVGALSIDVDTKSNVVTLTGDVESSEEKDLAEMIAKNTDHVKSVNNKLTIVNS